jgi:glucose-1-phosphate thymidylyltransferase
MNLKGVILAGGQGTRLLPATKVVNKHLLPVGADCKPMIQHCVEKMLRTGVKEIMVVTGGEHLGGIAEFLGGGEEYGCEFHYRVQDKPGGIAQALGLAESFVGKNNVFVLLGDNIFKDDPKDMVDAFEEGVTKRGAEAMVILKQVPDPQRYGVVTIDQKHGWRVIEIEEKPKNPKSNYIVTGLYFYNWRVFDIIKTLKPSGRGELEITDVNNEYIRRGTMEYYMMKGWWTDAGTHESYQRANEFCLKDTRKN